MNKVWSLKGLLWLKLKSLLSPKLELENKIENVWNKIRA
jgi:hypothetical protein